jgi:hypothetical protein
MKPEVYPLNSWQGWINFFKENTGKGLSEKEASAMMKLYISGVDVKEALIKLKGEEK